MPDTEQVATEIIITIHHDLQFKGNRKTQNFLLKKNNLLLLCFKIT